MIIDKTYDNSLWLILCSDKVNRERIIEFIRNIPIKLHIRLQASLSFYMNEISVYNMNKLNGYYKNVLSDEVRTMGDMRYWYRINPQNGALHLGECIDDGEDKYDLFQMTLYPVNDSLINEQKSFDDYLLGDITYNYLENNYCDMISFHLLKFPFCDMVVNSCKDYPYDKNKYRLVNLDRIPYDYTINDLSDKDSVKRLIRGKRKSSR